MKLKLLPFTGKTVWQDNKPFIGFLFSLLLLHSVLKIIFYQYNHQLLFSGFEETNTVADKFNLVKWSLAYDLLVLFLINSGLLLLLQAGRLMPVKISAWLILPVFAIINSFAVLLNILDVFYFRFHFQRANADLLYVIDHPFKQVFHFNILIILLFSIIICGIIYWIWHLHKKLYTGFLNKRHCTLISVLLLFLILPAVVFRNSFTKILVPAYPLIELKNHQLPVVENSFHSFIYSVFRGGDAVLQKNYLPDTECDSVFPIRKSLQANTTKAGKKNIVLFIMESVPYDYFDSAGIYKLKMPFFDSLLQKSTFYNNAFGYSHESNKGITAILAGIPTLTDIPLYHSQYLNMPFTPIGIALKKINYHSFFCIGDEYDNFGFAKCMNWLGIDKYYCKEDIPGYNKLPAHSMGIQDEYVLDFFNQKINGQQAPFFAVHYNVSTHYPYDIPSDFAAGLPVDLSDPMRSMRYYDFSLQKFFSSAKNESWFMNTVFIFCSDHWLVPDDKHVSFNAVSGYRIPVIIYDPGVNEKKTSDQLVSQFDIMHTVLSIAGYKDSLISYGINLMDSSNVNKAVFSRASSTLYHTTDSSYILGFNYRNDRAEFLYNYKKDRELKFNLLKDMDAQNELNNLTLKMKAFLQKANRQYNNEAFK